MESWQIIWGHTLGQNLINASIVERPFQIMAFWRPVRGHTNMRGTISIQSMWDGFLTKQWFYNTSEDSHWGDPHWCSQCGKAFSENSTLLNHLNAHTEEKPYKWSHCKKVLSQNRKLTNHLRTHTGEKPYQCIHCWKAFSDNSILNNH